MVRILVTVLALLTVTVSSAWAQRPFGLHGWGPRVGVSIDPDQIHVGAHFDLGDLAPQLQLMPHVEVGFGDDVTVLAPMFELDYRFREDWGSWNPYLGAGIGPVFVFTDRRDDTELGVAIQGGIARRLSSQAGFLFFEFKLGLADYPDAKFTIGWNFGRSQRSRSQ